MITREQRDEFDEQGYLIVRDLLDVAADIEPCRESYVGYLDSLTELFIAETKFDLRGDFRTLSFADRMALLLGCSGGSVLQHLDPTLAMFLPDYRWRGDLPSAQRPELFRLIRSERLLNGLEGLIGPEITASPVCHFNLKLPRAKRDLAVKVAVAAEQNAPHRNLLWGFHVGIGSAWHTDAAYGFTDSFSSRIINAWIPLTPASPENSCLQVSPGSHRWNPETIISAERVAGNAVAIPAKPGDVIFLHNNLAHTSLDNEASTDIRWAFNIRYLATGDPTGRPFLPSFVARSRAAPERELHDPELWSRMWRAALEFLSNNPYPPTLGRTQDEAEAITARWQQATREYSDWLDISSKFDGWYGPRA
jgi:phytanoyl-CoA hydroxylase